MESSFQPTTDLFHRSAQAPGTDETLDRLEIAVQSAIAPERADLRADVAVGGFDAPGRPQRLVKFQPLGGTQELACENAGGVHRHGPALARCNRAHRYV